MAVKYLVAKGRSVFTRDHRQLFEGADVTEIGLKNLEHHVKSGHVVRVGEEQSGVAPEPPTKFVDALKADQDADPKRGGSLESVGKWRFDPKGLADKSLDQLNVIVKERDNSIAEFDKRADAIECLTADWKGARPTEPAWEGKAPEADLKPAPAPRPAAKK